MLQISHLTLSAKIYKLEQIINKILTNNPNGYTLSRMTNDIPTTPSAPAPASLSGEAALSSTSQNTVPATPDDDEDTHRIDLLDAYDPADYRWVPVKRRPRLDGWTEEKQRRFIEVLADTGMVSAAAKAAGMTREGAYALRRSAHGAAFGRAWDAARHHAGSLLEDIAFERAIEGIEQNVFNEYGEVICTKRVYNDRLLQFLIRHLKPERYGGDALTQPASPPVTVDACLREMEPQLPASAPEFLGEETLMDELEIAECADSVLPPFLSEQRPEKSAARLAAEAQAAQQARGEVAWEKVENKTGELSAQEFADLCRAIDPTSHVSQSRRHFR
jgi:hypothetical protein